MVGNFHVLDQIEYIEQKITVWKVLKAKKLLDNS